MTENRWKWGVRWLIAAILVGCVVYLSKQSPYGFLLGLPLLIVVAILIMPEILKPISWMVDSLFGTGVVFGERPPLDLRLAQHYVKEERWDDAIEEYARVRGYYPAIPDVYTEPMILLAKLGAEKEEIEELFAKGQHKITDQEAKADLKRAYESALEELGHQRAGNDSLPISS
tara:strand:- start:18736 stop:19254 length:519 start_codon:yes stop_codon:yes gene_type:complete